MAKFDLVLKGITIPLKTFGCVKLDELDVDTEINADEIHAYSDLISSLFCDLTAFISHIDKIKRNNKSTTKVGGSDLDSIAELLEDYQKEKEESSSKEKEEDDNIKI